MRNRNVRQRARIMIVEQDWDYGIGLADWLAANGYQPVLIRSVDAAIAELSVVRPQALVVGLGSCVPQSHMEAMDVLLLLKTICPGVPAIAVADDPGLIPLIIRQASRRCLRRAVGFPAVGEALVHELDAAPKPDVGSSAGPRPIVNGPPRASAQSAQEAGR